MALAVLPCRDTDTCNEINSTETAQASHLENHSNEMCTPLCVCSCCASLFLTKDIQPILNQIATINTIYTVHPESKTSSAVIPIWQPPKLV